MFNFAVQSMERISLLFCEIIGKRLDGNQHEKAHGRVNLILPTLLEQPENMWLEHMTHGSQPKRASELDVGAGYARLVHVVGVLKLQRPKQRVAAGVVAPVGDIDAAHERRQLACAGAVLPSLLRLRVHQNLWAAHMTE